ncbi:hypothetical protein I3F58_25265, partial [Streptomyces sp. MUM 203J]|nr:hypothetical protein [Streptomyces sp. MUM 203J]
MTADENENQHRHGHQPEPQHRSEPQQSPEPHQPHPPHQEGGGWQPIPAGEYDGDVTAFVQLPPGAGLDGIPLEAPGHGYVPPRIDDPHATAQWNFQEALAAEEAHGHPSSPAGPASGADLTGQWTIPVAQGDLPEESGEYRIGGGRPAPAADWTGTGAVPAGGSAGGPGGITPPATLPGGAPAPWAVEPEPHPVVPPQAPRHAPEGEAAPVRDRA